MSFVELYPFIMSLEQINTGHFFIAILLALILIVFYNRFVLNNVISELETQNLKLDKCMQAFKRRIISTEKLIEEVHKNSINNP